MPKKSALLPDWNAALPGSVSWGMICLKSKEPVI